MDTDLMPKDQKQIVAKTLLDLNYSATEIAEILGIHRTTVYRYAEKPTRKDLQHFATEIESMMTAKLTQLLAKVITKLSEQVDETDDPRVLIVIFSVIKKHLPSLFEIKEKEIERDSKIFFKDWD